MIRTVCVHTSRDLGAKACQVADLLRTPANDRRLLILCRPAGRGKATGGRLADNVELSQSALSQQLAGMRKEADPRALATLNRLYCR